MRTALDTAYKAAQDENKKVEAENKKRANQQAGDGAAPKKRQRKGQAAQAAAPAAPGARR